MAKQPFSYISYINKSTYFNPVAALDNWIVNHLARYICLNATHGLIQAFVLPSCFMQVLHSGLLINSYATVLKDQPGRQPALQPYMALRMEPNPLSQVYNFPTKKIRQVPFMCDERQPAHS